MEDVSKEQWLKISVWNEAWEKEDIYRQEEERSEDKRDECRKWRNLPSVALYTRLIFYTLSHSISSFSSQTGRK